MWHCWCRFLFEKKMRWIFERKKSTNQIAVYQSFDQSSNAILIHSEFMGVFINGREALMLMKHHGRYSISTFPFLNSFLNTRFCQALFIRELFPKRVVIVGMVSKWLIRVKISPVLGLVPFSESHFTNHHKNLKIGPWGLFEKIAFLSLPLKTEFIGGGL